MPAQAHVLLVDDDPSDRLPLEQLLRAEGFVVSTASDGAEALEQAAITHPDLVLTDLQMEPMGGVELCRRLHEIDRDLPVIVITGMTDRQLVIDSLRAGAEDYLTKPVDWDTALWRVNRAIERRAIKLDDDNLRRTLNERLVLSSVREQEHADREGRQRMQLHAVLENLHEGVVIAGPDRTVLMVNAAARDILELGDLEIPNVDALYVNHVLAPDGRLLDTSERPLMRALRGEAFGDAQSTHVSAKGTRRHLVSSGTSVRDEQGNLVLAIVAFRDVTDQKRLEQQREEYLALVSHDLRNPLSSIAMSLFVLKESTKNASLAVEDAVKLAERGERNVARITRMLDELTEATTMELRGVELERRPCDLREIVVSALDGMNDTNAGRVTIEAEGASFPIRGDASRLARVVTNLLSNALKYSPPGMPVTARLSESGAEVRLDVIDRGIGIDPEGMKIVFERYGRTRAGRAAAGGLGLGLYIARWIVQAHGGRIDVSSELGRGSVFSLILPSQTATARSESIEL